MKNQSVADGERWQACFNRGAAKFDRGDFQGAISDFDDCIEIDPDDPDAWNGRGQAKRGLGDRKGYLADFDKAIELRKAAQGRGAE